MVSAQDPSIQQLDSADPDLEPQFAAQTGVQTGRQAEQPFAIDLSQPQPQERYLWAVGEAAARIAVGTLVGDRYRVIQPSIWLDTQPQQPPALPRLQPHLQAYLKLYPQQLYLPTIYGVVPEDAAQESTALEDTVPEGAAILLLSNAPIAQGTLLPSLETAWAGATAVRQVYWLWQLLGLWRSLKAHGVAKSLLVPENIRVEGWRVRLCELFADPPAVPQLEELPVPLFPALRDLAIVWQPWIDNAQPQVVETLQAISRKLRTATTDADQQAIEVQLNQLLLWQTAQRSLRLQIAGGTTPGTQRSHNEDACYPDCATPDRTIVPSIGILCDGVGGHDGGEVASQLGLRSLQLPLQTLLAEVAEQNEPLSPAIVEQQLISTVRIANNLIAAQNDLQGRSQRQRMGTTLAMALQLPQPIGTAPNSASELYLVHVGDSRAYWLTPTACHCLTIDDDVQTREVRYGRCFPAESSQRPDASALTQALGTRPADALTPHVQRFVIEEDGILLLCSDGLSDRDRVAQFGPQMAQAVLDGQPLEAAVQTWLEIADRLNGHDNAAVVLMRCQISDTVTLPDLDDPFTQSHSSQTAEPYATHADFTAASRALLNEDFAPASPPSPPIVDRPEPKPSRKFWLLALGIAAVMFSTGALGMALWRQLDPIGFEQLWQPRSAPQDSQTE